MLKQFFLIFFTHVYYIHSQQLLKLGNFDITYYNGGTSTFFSISSIISNHNSWIAIGFNNKKIMVKIKLIQILSY